MAKFIEITSSGSGLDGGKILLGVENINGVIAASATTTVIKFNGGGLDEGFRRSYYHSYISRYYTFCA